MTTRAYMNYLQLLEGLSTAVVVLDESLRISYINPAAEVTLSVSYARVVGSAFADWVSEEEGNTRALQRALWQQQQYTKRRVLWHLPNGEDLTVDYSVNTLPDGKGVVIEVQPVDRLLKISREEAHISTQETTRHLVRGMAHEIKNPLGGIRGAAQLLSKELPSPELREYTQVIIDESDRLRKLVDRLLGPNQAPSMRRVNIHEVLERVATLISAEGTGLLSIKRDYDPSIPDVIGDIELLIQAVLNIVRNAMQALSEANTLSPLITLKTRIQRQFTIGREHHRLVCRLDIIDNGPGIAPSLVDTLFYPMISGRAEGSGLGLSISQQLVAQHRGLIECNSKPGCTVFTLYIPMEQPSDNS